MTHMQIAGDVRRRNDDAKWLRVRPVGAASPESAGFLPKRGGAAFRRSEVERFFHHEILVCDAIGDAPEIRQRPSERSGWLRTPQAQAPRRYKCVAGVEVNARESRESTSARARPSEFPPAP